jgi:hypothetical protein
MAVVILLLLELKFVRIVLIVVRLPLNHVREEESMLRPVKKDVPERVVFPFKRSSGRRVSEQPTDFRVVFMESALRKPQ